jgi:hypothetical protein
MRNRSLLLFAVLAAASCASPSARHAAGSAPPGAGTGPVACPAVPDVKELLARHALAFGSREAVARALPRSFAGEVVTQGKKGTVELALDRGGRFSQTAVVGGMLSGSGVDANGPWSLPYAGVPLRLRADEAVEVAFGAWLEGRDYLAAFDPRRDAATCTVGAAGPQVSVRYGLPEVGNPELAFGLADAALLSVTHLDVQDHETVLDFRGWSDADQAGVRWPRAIHWKEASGSESLVTWTRSGPGLACPSRPSEGCLAPPGARLAFSWPEQTPVRVPAAFFMNEVLLRAEVGGRSCWGLVDSGATLQFVDAGSPLLGAFHPAVAAKRSASEQDSPVIPGEIPGAVALGDLVVRSFPAAAVPLPSFDEFGARRPEMLVGHPLFLGTAVRIDYARQELLLARDARVLHGSGAVAIPLKVMGESVVTEARLDSIAGWFELDTGYSEALYLYQNWAEGHGFPGQRPTVTVRQQSEIGTNQVDEQRMRPRTFELGPIRLAEPLVPIASARGLSDRIAGQLGNGVFARCAAVVFDIPNRTLWLEPPCDRDVAEDLSGWVLSRKDSTAHPDRPWVVRFVIPGGAADLAGVKAGDRILRIGGRAAMLERSTFESVTQQAPGTAVPAVIVRGGERMEVMLTLVRMLAR